MAGAVVGGVDGGLLRADVVRPDGGAGVLGSLGDKAAAGKEIDEGWKGCVQEQNCSAWSLLGRNFFCRVIQISACTVRFDLFLFARGPLEGQDR